MSAHTTALCDNFQAAYEARLRELGDEGNFNKASADISELLTGFKAADAIYLNKLAAEIDKAGLPPKTRQQFHAYAAWLAAAPARLAEIARLRADLTAIVPANGALIEKFLDDLAQWYFEFTSAAVAMQAVATTVGHLKCFLPSGRSQPLEGVPGDNALVTRPSPTPG